jgi:hypothetical protein
MLLALKCQDGTHGNFEKFLASLLARATALAKIGSPDIGLKNGNNLIRFLSDLL